MSNTLQSLRVSDSVLDGKFQKSLYNLEYSTKRANRNKINNFEETKSKELKRKLIDGEKLDYLFIRIYRERARATTDSDKKKLEEILTGLLLGDSSSIAKAQKYLLLSLEEKRERRLSNKASNSATTISDHLTETNVSATKS